MFQPHCNHKQWYTQSFFGRRRSFLVCSLIIRLFVVHSFDHRSFILSPFVCCYHRFSRRSFIRSSWYHIILFSSPKIFRPIHQSYKLCWLWIFFLNSSKIKFYIAVLVVELRHYSDYTWPFGFSIFKILVPRKTEICIQKIRFHFFWFGLTEICIQKIRFHFFWFGFCSNWIYRSLAKKTQF
jgi:hypothetical protein